MKTSLIWKISKGELQNILDESKTIVEVLIRLGFDAYNGNHRTLNKRIKEDCLSLEKFNDNHKRYISDKRKLKEIPLEDILIENSKYPRRNLKKRLIVSGKIIYKCEKCNNDGEWMGGKICLQLEHKNGINNDNRLDNLCFLCPNCHSQTSTYSGKNARHKKNIYLCPCGLERDKKAKMCCECYSKIKVESQLLLPELKKEELVKLLREMPITSIAEKLGISGNGVRKYAKRMGIDYKSVSKYSYSKEKI